MEGGEGSPPFGPPKHWVTPNHYIQHGKPQFYLRKSTDRVDPPYLQILYIGELAYSLTPKSIFAVLSHLFIEMCRVGKNWNLLTCKFPWSIKQEDTDFFQFSYCKCPFLYMWRKNSPHFLYFFLMILLFKNGLIA